MLVSVFEFFAGFGMPVLFKGAEYYSFQGNIYRTITITLSILLIAFLIQKLLLQNIYFILTFGNNRISSKKLIIWFIFGIVLYLLSFIIATFGSGIRLSFSPDELRIKILLSSVIIQFFISAKEEILYRCILLQVLDKTKTSKYLVITVSAVVFTFSHVVGHSSISLINIFISGLIWGFLVYKEKGIEVVFVFHVSSNIMVSVFLYLFNFSNWQIGIIFNLLSLILYFVYMNIGRLRRVVINSESVNING